MPTTNYGELAYIFNEETQYGETFQVINMAGRVLLKQCGTLLTRNIYQIKGIRLHKFFLQSVYITVH